MKKKLKLSRETLRSLDRVNGVFGGSVGPGPTHALGCEPTNVGTNCITGTGSYDTCAPSYRCSTNCETGGACTFSCAGC
jgi:hypothetical protein